MSFDTDEGGEERLIIAMFALAVEDAKLGDATAAAWLVGPQAIHWAEALGLDATKLLANVSRLVAEHGKKPRSVHDKNDLTESFELYCQGKIGYKELVRQYGVEFESIRARWRSNRLIITGGESYDRAIELHEGWRVSTLPLNEYAETCDMKPADMVELFRRHGLGTALKRKATIKPDEVEQQYADWLKSGMSVESYSRSLGYAGNTIRTRFKKMGYDVPVRRACAE